MVLRSYSRLYSQKSLLAGLGTLWDKGVRTWVCPVLATCETNALSLCYSSCPSFIHEACLCSMKHALGNKVLKGFLLQWIMVNLKYILGNENFYIFVAL